MERLDLISELNLKEFKEIFKKDLIKSFFTLKSILVFLCFFSITVFVTIFLRNEYMVFNGPLLAYAWLFILLLYWLKCFLTGIMLSSNLMNINKWLAVK